MKAWKVNLDYPYNHLSKTIWMGITIVVLGSWVNNISSHLHSCQGEFPFICASM